MPLLSVYPSISNLAASRRPFLELMWLSNLIVTPWQSNTITSTSVSIFQLFRIQVRENKCTLILGLRWLHPEPPSSLWLCPSHIQPIYPLQPMSSGHYSHTWPHIFRHEDGTVLRRIWTDAPDFAIIRLTWLSGAPVSSQFSTKSVPWSAHSFLVRNFQVQRSDRNPSRLQNLIRRYSVNTPESGVPCKS
jgi:hypothetical protein